MKIRKIAILGGGTAGWLAANHLGLALSADPEVEITVIESADVPTIGVGEGTVPYIGKSLRSFGIAEKDMFLRCDATFKQGIKFVNWMDTTRHGMNKYYHPFDSPDPQGADLTDFWLNQSDLPFDELTIQTAVCELGLAPKPIDSREYSGTLAYAYHFDARKFALLLAENARERFRVGYHNATIVAASRAPDGRIIHLVTEQGIELGFDFYIDCSGFTSLLIDKTLQVPFMSQASQLLTDKALVQQVPTADNVPITPYTTATAHSAGWIWDIPLTNRRGTGFVYSSHHMSQQQAIETYANYLGVNADSLSPRSINMEIGYRTEYWCENCVALGLAQGFVEPLEATSILVTDLSAELLALKFPRHLTDMAAQRPYYNKAIRYIWDSVTDFIKLHYYLSDRQDSLFWSDNRNTSSLSELLRERLDMFSQRPPHQYDFFSRFDIFTRKNFLYVLYGMQYPTTPPILTDRQRQQALTALSANKAALQKAQETLLPQREWLNLLRQHQR